MSVLTFTEQQQLEKLFEMGGGDVLDFSNETFGDFIHALVARDIFHESYDGGNGSTADRLRTFWRIESNLIVAEVIDSLLGHYVVDEALDLDAKGPLIDACQEIIVRLRTVGAAIGSTTAPP
jgi:hypothetical protein